MRIAYVVDTFPKISETFVRDEVEWLARRGQLDRVFALQQEPAAMAELSPTVRARTYLIDSPEQSGVARGRQQAIWLGRQPALLVARLKALSLAHESRDIFMRGLALAEQLRRDPPDILHVHFAGLSLQIARYASRLTGIPLTFCVHHYDLFLSPPPNLKVLASEAARVITISKYNRRHMTGAYGVPFDKIDVVHCGIDPTRLAPDTDAPRTPANAPLRLLTVGRLTSIKAHRDLITACHLLAERGVSFQLHIIGEGEERPALEAQIEACNLQEQITLLGAQPSAVVRERLARTDVFVMSSLSEGIPVALMEAMACELPVVSTDVRGIPELVIDAHTGLLVSPEQPEQLASAIAQMAGDEDRRRAMGRAGRRKVIDAFDADTEYRRLIDIWHGILESRKPRSKRARLNLSSV